VIATASITIARMIPRRNANSGPCAIFCLPSARPMSWNLGTELAEACEPLHARTKKSAVAQLNSTAGINALMGLLYM
jgi:hypothetical protein